MAPRPRGRRRTRACLGVCPSNAPAAASMRRRIDSPPEGGDLLSQRGEVALLHLNRRDGPAERPVEIG